MNNTWEQLFPFLRQHQPHGAAGAESREQRAAKRCPVSHSIGGVSAVIHGDNGEPTHGLLWDLSRSGACVLLNRLANFSRGQILRLSLRPGVGVDTVELKAQVCWTEPNRNRMYVGLMFQDEPLPFNTFLECIVNNA